MLTRKIIKITLQPGFSLIEALLSVMIFSAFLMVVFELEHHVMIHLFNALKANLIQLERNQVEEKMLFENLCTAEIDDD